MSGIEKKAAAMAAAEEEEVGRKAAAASDVGLKELSRKLNDFAKERDWEQYHSPRNLLLAWFASLLSLIGHRFILCCCSSWRDYSPAFSPYID